MEEGCGVVLIIILFILGVTATLAAAGFCGFAALFFGGGGIAIGYVIGLWNVSKKKERLPDRIKED